jgi:hypothetical protein
MTSLLLMLASSTSEATRIVIAGIPPVSGLQGVDRPFGAVVDRHALRLNEITRTLCEEFRRISYADLPAPLIPSPVRNGGSPAMYEGFARVLGRTTAESLAPARSSTGRTPRRLRDRPDDERARQDAVDSIKAAGLVDAPALQRIAELARTMLGTSYAAITVVDSDRQWPLAQAGYRHDGVEREVSFCARTIRGAGAMVLPDIARDPRFRDYPAMDMGLRFYAGFPVESPDGYRIGALCVTHHAPGPADYASVSALRDLAALVRRELERAQVDHRAPVPA